MNMQRSILALACASALAVFAAGSVQAQQVGTHAQGDLAVQLTQQFAAFAGSDGNAAALVQGLHGGQSFELAGSGSGSVTIKPDGGAMSYADVGQALGLAQAQLAKVGITHPDPAQIAGALNGGVLATAQGNTTVQGVLPVRSQVRNWAQVAQRIGVPFDARSALAMQGSAQIGQGMAGVGAAMGTEAAAQGMRMGRDAAKQGATLAADAARSGAAMGTDAARQGMRMGSDAAQQGMTAAEAARQGADAARQAAQAAKAAGAVEASGNAALDVQRPQLPPRPERPPVQRPQMPSMPGFGGR